MHQQLFVDRWPVCDVQAAVLVPMLSAVMGLGGTIFGGRQPVDVLCVSTSSASLVVSNDISQLTIQFKNTEWLRSYGLCNVDIAEVKYRCGRCSWREL